MHAILKKINKFIKNKKIILNNNEHKFVILNRLWVNKATFYTFKTCVAMNNLEFTQIAWISFAINFIF